CPPSRHGAGAGTARGSGRGGLDLDGAGPVDGGLVAAVGLFQAVVDHRIELAVLAVPGLAAAGEFEQAGHGLVLGVVVVVVHGFLPLAGTGEAGSVPMRWTAWRRAHVTRRVSNPRAAPLNDAGRRCGPLTRREWRRCYCCPHSPDTGHGGEMATTRKAGRATATAKKGKVAKKTAAKRAPARKTAAKK